MPAAKHTRTRVTPNGAGSPQIQIDPLVEGDGVAVATGLPVAGHAGLHQQPLALVVVVGCNLVRQRGTRSHDAHPFCQDEKNTKGADMLDYWLDLQVFCIANGTADSVLRQRIAATALRIIKNARRQFEGSGRARRRPLSPKRNRPIGANSQWDDSPQAARGYMNFDNRSRLMLPSARVSHREAATSR